MTKLDFIMVKEVQTVGIAICILESKKWFSWPLKIPAVGMLAVGAIAGNLTSFIHGSVYYAREGQVLSTTEFKRRMAELALTEKYRNIVERFTD